MKDLVHSPASTQLSVIVPFRADPSSPYLVERLEGLCKCFKNTREVEFIVIDSGSPTELRKNISSICEENGVRYIHHDTAGQVFSIGAARDYGVTHATGRAVTFLDVDLRFSDDFFDRLVRFMSSYGISRQKKKFFTVPCLYLTQEGTDEFLASCEDQRMLDFYLRWLDGDNHAIQNMAPCSSVMVVDRLHYLSVGGHRPEFRGHGYEDFELYHRLMVEEGALPRARDYYHDTKTWDTATYRGFRSQLSLLGRHAMMANIFVIHLWHPRPRSNSFYANLAANREIWLEFFRKFDSNRQHPSPLVSTGARFGKFIMFGKPRTAPADCLKDVLPILGEVLFVNEQDFVDDEMRLLDADLAALIEQHGVQAMLFPNPYANPARLEVYDWCRRTGFPYLCWERGALPDSWFFDNRGFNFDSASYAEQNWQRDLTSDERSAVIRYINEVLTGANTLERQGLRISGEGLAAKLRVGGRKVLFVPLQRPSDTVIRHFAGGVGSQEAFLEFIDEAAEKLNRRGWVVLCKKHPLESEVPTLQHAQLVPDDTHFIDLLELADAVAVINSGVGVYAAMMGKPCYVFGNAFYAFQGINQCASAVDPAAFCSQVTSSYTVDMERVYQFIHYLRNDFYSFGRPSTKIRQEKDGSLRNITTGIDFYEIRIPGMHPVIYQRPEERRISTGSPLFERFRLDLEQEGNREKIAVRETAVTRRKDKWAAKLRKLFRDPHAFFGDSRVQFLRPLRFAFPRR
ncbi:glycosyltransferase [Caldimonas thermodepolymerans]|uniref:Glycosyltransferase n=1 Tax=Caldimonas thermodepolymerans TaxID=215580 RepID=A0A2S5T419_9BURK|nr:glycosyltransferase [Caldimonas thermodepolymerans]PPE69730.1 glycosyltransferase [Caldimonas thermodepolymerans]QPC31859.1 glycosyltransferase [Caldimonas thermodepolymerans]RDI01630.1 putative glycosyltransferase involved in capsule biosynthesis [Caldimonas thermodepolymerans]